MLIIYLSQRFSSNRNWNFLLSTLRDRREAHRMGLAKAQSLMFLLVGCGYGIGEIQIFISSENYYDAKKIESNLSTLKLPLRTHQITPKRCLKPSSTSLFLSKHLETHISFRLSSRHRFRKILFLCEGISVERCKLKWREFSIITILLRAIRIVCWLGALHRIKL